MIDNARIMSTHVCFSELTLLGVLGDVCNRELKQFYHDWINFNV